MESRATAGRARPGEAALAFVFERERRRLLAIAYRMLGVLGDAEDVVQDAWLRLARAVAEGRTPEAVPAWLTTTVTRLAVDELRRRRRRPTASPFVAEPVLADDALAPEPSAVRREGLSLGMMTLLEQLTPLQRATFVLRDAFGDDHRGIAATLGIGEASARQHYRRARLKLSAWAHEAEDAAPGRAPVTSPATSPAESPATVEPLLDALTDALLAGDRQALLQVLRGDAVALHDGGGRVPAAIRPIETAARIAQVYLHIGGKLATAGSLTVRRVALVGETACALVQDGHLVSLNAVRARPDDPGRIALVCGVVDPVKLARAARGLGLPLRADAARDVSAAAAGAAP